MFLRRKKVGRYHYLQILESERTQDGPRNRVVASLGREDKLRESGELDRLVERLGYRVAPGDRARTLSATGTLPDVEEPVGTTTRLPLRKGVLGRIIAERAVAALGLHDVMEAIALTDSEREGAVGALAEALVPERARLDPAPLIALGRNERAHARLLARMVTIGAGRERLLVNVARSVPPTDRLSPLRGTICATATTAAGLPLMGACWPEASSLPAMIQSRVEEMLRSLPGRRLTLSLEHHLVTVRLLRSLHDAGVRFQVCLFEPSTTLERVPERVFEERIPSGPFHEIAGLRYVRALDPAVASREQAARGALLSRMSQADHNGSTAGRRAMEKVRSLERWDGATLVVTNATVSPREVMELHVAARRAQAFNAAVANLCARVDVLSYPAKDAADFAKGVGFVQLLATLIGDSLCNRLRRTASMSCGGSQEPTADHITNWDTHAQAVRALDPAILSLGGSRSISLVEPEPECRRLLNLLQLDETNLSGMLLEGAVCAMERGDQAECRTRSIGSAAPSVPQ